MGTKPRTIITLPHLIGRQKPVSPKVNNTPQQPIIIRERVEPEKMDKGPESPSVGSYTSTLSANSRQSNQRVSSSP